MILFSLGSVIGKVKLVDNQTALILEAGFENFVLNESPYYLVWQTLWIARPIYDQPEKFPPKSSFLIMDLVLQLPLSQKFHLWLVVTEAKVCELCKGVTSRHKMMNSRIRAERTVDSFPEDIEWDRMRWNTLFSRSLAQGLVPNFLIVWPLFIKFYFWKFLSGFLILIFTAYRVP